MIRLSQKSDLNDIISVWNESFGDSYEDIKFFLDSRYVSENTVVCEHDGKVVSVLFLLDGSMYINGSDYPSYYLYAACTLTEFRGKGIMAQMLSFAKSLSESRNKYFIVLKPGEKSLFGYYEKFGYKTVFSNKIVEINDFHHNQITAITKNITCETIKSRDNIFDNINYFKWDSDAVAFAIKHHEYFGGNYYSDSDGYILYYIKDSVLFVKESTISDNEKLLDIIGSDNIKSVRIELPVNFDIACNNCRISDSGMILALNEKAEELASGLKNAYLNLALD